MFGSVVLWPKMTSLPPVVAGAARRGGDTAGSMPPPVGARARQGTRHKLRIKQYCLRQESPDICVMACVLTRDIGVATVPAREGNVRLLLYTQYIRAGWGNPLLFCGRAETTESRTLTGDEPAGGSLRQ